MHTTQRALGAIAVLLLGPGLLIPSRTEAQHRPLRHFDRVLLLEDSAQTSANAGVGDLDGDGDLDIVLAKGRHWPLHDRVLLNNGRGRFVARNLGAAPDRTYSGVLADLDGDGDLDMVVSNDRPDRKLVYLNDGRAGFEVAGTWGDPRWPTRNAAVADLNGDGRPDIIAANRGAPSNVCLNGGRGYFPSSGCLALATQSATSIVPADFDGDGDIDLAVPHRDSGQSAIHLNDGRGSFRGTKPFGPATTAARTAAAGDLNGDGRVDLVLGDEYAGVTVYLNRGDGDLGAGVALGDGTLSPYAIAIGDLNRDGAADVVLGYVGAPGAVFFNDGTGRAFDVVRFGDGRGSVYGLALGDLDSDGYLDIVAARSEAPNVAYFSAAGPPARSGQDDSTARKEAVVTVRASGTFEVKLTPQATDEAAEGGTLGRMSIDKRFHGDLEGTSKGEMLTAGTGVEGSAGYVAIERVSGTLHGRSGTFVLQHRGTLTRWRTRADHYRGAGLRNRSAGGPLRAR